MINEDLLRSLTPIKPFTIQEIKGIRDKLLFSKDDFAYILGIEVRILKLVESDIRPLPPNTWCVMVQLREKLEGLDHSGVMQLRDKIKGFSVVGGHLGFLKWLFKE